MVFKVISFYKYIKIEDPNSLMIKIRAKCNSQNIFGRILLGEEGLNGAVCGKLEDIIEFKEFICEMKEFNDLTFREQSVKKQSYHKLVIRIRKEICAFGKEVDLKNVGEYLDPKELDEMYQNKKEGKDDFVIIDARNDYEFEIGHFQDAKKLDIQNFREFASVVKNDFTDLKDKKVVLYCTGGIRCEKASAFMKEEGFDKVYHLKGGIINYINYKNENDIETFRENEESVGKWKGGLFVFDDRKVSECAKAIAKCELCNEKSNEMINCFNLDCDKLFSCCQKCQEKMGKVCSQECKGAKRFRVEVKDDESGIVVAKIDNYYAKANAALIKVVNKGIEVGAKIFVSGHTTERFSQEIKEMRSENGEIINSANVGDVVTVLMQNKVRENDVISLAS